MCKQLVVAVATALFALSAYGQQYPSSNPAQDDTYGQDQSTQVNCSDPSMASSPQCAQGAGSGTLGSGAALPGATSLGTNPIQPSTVPTFNEQANRQRAGTAGANQILLRPEPLTEFQKFVASTTGVVLPVYGAQLFANVPSTFAPIENTPVPPDYVLGPDDELRIRVWGQVNFNANVRVDRAGNVFIPQIGSVQVAGLRFSDVEQHLRDAISRVYKNFQVQVEIGQIRTVQVYVTGEARRPGVYTVSSLATLVDALFASGGPSVQGSMRHIELRRGGDVVTALDLYDLLVNGDKTHDAKLLPGDVIYIPAVGAQAAVMGSVRRAAIYELLAGETLDAVLHDAGGASTLAAQARTSIDRSSDHTGRLAMEVSLDKSGLSTPLQDGDIIRVLPEVSRYQKTVTLRGNTANPGRFAWHEGMRISELIPDRDALLTRDYWWKRAELGLPAPEFEPIPALSAMRQPSGPVEIRQYNAAQQQQQQLMMARTSQMMNQPERPVSSEDPYEDSGTYNNVYGQPPAQNYPQPYGQQQAPTTGTAANPAGMTTIPGTVDNTGAQQQVQYQRNPNAQGNQSALAEDDSDENQPFNPRLRPRNVIRQTAPDIDWSYAVIERTDPVTLKTTLVPFDLGKLVIDHDQSQDLALQPGDIVTIFSQADIHVPIAEQTAFVRLQGEFVHSGTYSVLPGETLRQLVERAGGLTPNAYLYGSVFTRESTRLLQQRRIDEFVRQMTLEMERGNVALAVNPYSNAQDLASASAAQTSEREIVAGLQQIRANGRIVFQFRPDSAGVNAIPDMKLENGDTFLVPSVPTTVNVLGAVFNQNSFVYRPDARVKATLDLAGGPNSDADGKRMFVIRANGAVVSRTTVNGLWGDQFFHLRLYPGDTIIVPEKVAKPSAVRALIDWTQIFSSLAFGAAALQFIQ